jgi:hypothetical protein
MLKPINLWQMIQFFARDAVKAVGDMKAATEFVKSIKDKDAGEILSKAHNHTISGLLATTKAVCEELKLPASTNQVNNLIDHLRFVGRNASEVFTNVKELELSLIKELQAVNFAFIPADKLQYFEKDLSESLFGTPVWAYFEDAREDIKDAGNCLAADLHDGAVFYLMRVVETGLRKLARKLKVKTPNKPLDYAGWAEVVKAIDDKLTAKIPKSRSAKKITALKFKHELLVDFKAFEVIRNEAMHGRSHHNEQEAVGLFNRVRDFMQRLAKNL